MAAMAKRTVTLELDDDLIALIERYAGDRGIKSYVAEALEEKVDTDQRRAVLLEWLEELERGDPTDDPIKELVRRQAARTIAAVEG